MNETSSDFLSSRSLSEIGCFDDFIGREKRVSALDELMKIHRLITLVGPGGIGKTRLAREVFNRDSQDVAHGRAAAFVSLELVTTDSAEAVLAALASGLNLVLSDADDLRQALVKRLGDTPMLLVLDNCETARKNVALLVLDFLNKCPKLRIIATSQHELGVPGALSEKIHVLPPLSVPDKYSGSLDSLKDFESYQFFLARARRLGDTWVPDENGASSLRRILQLTDGIPLAIEIIAAWAPYMPLEEIFGQLSNTLFGAVTAIDDYCIVPTARHSSMLLCLDWSFNQLLRTYPNEAECFKQLGIFEGRFTEDAVGKICKVADNPRKLLIHLAKTSFVQICPGTNPLRYKLLNFYREFAHEKAREEKLHEQLSVRHLNYYLSLIQPNAVVEVGKKDLVTTSWEDDWPNLIAVANAASGIGNPRAAWIISGALGPFLKKRGLWSECERLNQAAVEAADGAKYWPALVRSLLDLGIILEKQGRWSDAAEQYQTSLRFADRSVPINTNHQVMALQHLIAVLTKMGKLDDADRLRMRYGGVSQLLETPGAKARANDAKGKEFQDRRDFAKAEAEYREAFRIRNEIGDAEGLARSKSNLGTVLTLQGEAWPEAEKMLRESLIHWNHVGDTRQQAVVMHLLADMFRRQGHKVEARYFCDECLKLRENDPKGRAVILSLLAKIHVSDGKLPEAIKVLTENRTLCHSIGDSEGEGIACDQIGLIYMSQKDWDKALDALGESRKIKESPTRRDVAGLGLTLDRIAQVYARCGEWEKAQTTYNDSLRYSLDAGQKIAAVVTQMNVAMLYAAQGLKETALKTLDGSIASLNKERYDTWFLKEACNLRSQLDRNMREGNPWVHWRDAAFKSQQYDIRKQFDHERKIKDWPKVVSGYKNLADSFIESGQQMEAALALNELSSAYCELPDVARADDAIRKALAIFEGIPLPLGQGASWHKLGNLFVEQHQWQNAQNAYNNSIKFKQDCFNDLGEAISQDPLFDVLIKIGGRLDAAERAINRSWEITGKIGTDTQKWYTLARLLRLKVEQNNPVETLIRAKELSELIPSDTALVNTARELLAMAEAGNWNALKTRLSREDITKIKDIPVSTSDDQEPHDSITARVALQQEILPQETEPQVYVSYAWGEDRTEEGRKREEIVNLLCERVRATSRRIGRDKDSTAPGDSIEEFTQRIAQAPRIVAVISAKSLVSEYCMVDELFSAFLYVGYDMKKFRAKLIAVVMKDAEPMLERTLHKVGVHWRKTHKKELKYLKRVDCDHTNIVRWEKVGKMGDMCRHLDQMLHVINDTIMPRGFEQNVANNFEAVISRLLPESSQ